ncbi:MAG: hypothetical protein V4633_23460 [Pseudomonadota bacterium]
MPPTLVASLAEQLRISGKTMSPTQALSAAIETWIALERQAKEAAGPLRGYQWKTLFLPEGTQLRMNSCGIAHYARVEGEYIVFEGRNVSPRGMTLAIAGVGRNAWRDLWLMLPGERFWKQAQTCRRQSECIQNKPDPTAGDAMAETAAAMSNALRSALLLADRAAEQSALPSERRVQRLRRSSDILSADCAFD